MIQDPISIGSGRASSEDGVHRAEAFAGAGLVWWESVDVPLAPRAEAWASAMLVVAAGAGTRLKVEDPVSAVWLHNVEVILEVWKEWWGYAALAPIASPSAPAGPPRDAAALCFTGGVDSFHSLLCGETRPSVLVYCHGYDISLHDEIRADSWHRSFRAIAREVDIRSVWIRTNLREHQRFAAVAWERSHGGALAATAHLLEDMAGVLLVSSGLSDAQAVPWGSHPRIDPHWSSERVEIRRSGGDRTRLEKISEIVGHELPQRHLRVCWEHRRPTGNCSRCDKCLCTMLLIDACGAAGRFDEIFDWSGRLAAHLDQVPTTLYVRTYTELLGTDPPRRLARAIRRLLERSEACSDDAVVGPVAPSG